MKAIVLKNRKGYKNLEVTMVKEPKIKNKEVMIRIKYASVNYADILSTKGLYNWQGKTPYILGIDGTGTVEKIGQKVTKYKKGDRVIIAGKTGTYAELTARHEDTIWPIPENLSYEEAASLPSNWLTAWIAIFEMARCRKNETALIQAAAGGVGTAASQLAQSLGMKVYGTTSTPAKKKYLRKLGITPLNYEDFDKKIKPDFILESIGGDIHKRSIKTLAPLGRIVSIGATSIKIQKWNPISWIKAWKNMPRIKRSELQSQAYMTFHAGVLYEKHREKIEPIWSRMTKYIIKNKLRPKIQKTSIYPMTQTAKVFELIDTRQNIGKILLDPTR